MSNGLRTKSRTTRFSGRRRSAHTARTAATRAALHEASHHSANCGSLGGWIDAAIVGIVVGFWLNYGPRGAVRDLFDVCVPVSLGGVYVAARRLLFAQSPLPAGVALWGGHGLVGVLAIAVFMSSGADTGDAATASSRRVLLYCLAALAVQILLGVVALFRLIHRRTSGRADAIGSAVGAVYAVAMGAWLTAILS